MKKVELTDKIHTSHWGASDFYPQVEEKLQQLLDDIQNSDDGDIRLEVNGAAKKEVHYFKIILSKDGAEVVCSEGMDEDEDLVYDAIWNLYRTEPEINEHVMENILESMIEEGVTSYAEVNATSVLTIKKIKETLNKGFEDTRKKLDYQFNIVKEIVKNHVESGDIALDNI